MKKVIRLTEADLRKIIQKVISEQDEEEYSFMIAVQKFLNNRYKNDKKFVPLKLDGKSGTGSATESAIKRYQIEKGLEDDGKIGHETSTAMRKDGLGKFESKFLGLF